MEAVSRCNLRRCVGVILTDLWDIAKSVTDTASLEHLNCKSKGYGKQKVKTKAES